MVSRTDKIKILNIKITRFGNICAAICRGCYATEEMTLKLYTTMVTSTLTYERICCTMRKRQESINLNIMKYCEHFLNYIELL